MLNQPPIRRNTMQNSHWHRAAINKNTTQQSSNLDGVKDLQLHLLNMVCPSRILLRSVSAWEGARGSGDTHLSSGSNSNSISRPQVPDEIASFSHSRIFYLRLGVCSLVAIVVFPGPDDLVFFERALGMDVPLQVPDRLLRDHVCQAALALNGFRDGHCLPELISIRRL